MKEILEKLFPWLFLLGILLLLGWLCHMAGPMDDADMWRILYFSKP